MRTIMQDLLYAKFILCNIYLVEMTYNCQAYKILLDKIHCTFFFPYKIQYYINQTDTVNANYNSNAYFEFSS